MALAYLYTIEAELKNRSKRSLADGIEKDAMTKLRLLCLSRGPTQILRIGRIFRRLDPDDSRSLNFEEFSNGMKESGLGCSDDDIVEIFQKLDTDRSGTINIGKFLVAFRPPLSPTRMEVIEKSFKKLNKTEDDVITIEDLKNVYNAKWHSAYIRGEMTEKEILNEFLATFENHNSINSKITKEEFINYYSIVSASIDNDTAFDLVMRHCYRL